MESIKGNQEKFVKRGSAQFRLSTLQTVSSANTLVNIFETQVTNDSFNITKVSNSSLQLKANIKYRVTAMVAISGFSANGSTYVRFRNNTTGTILDESPAGENVTLTYSANNYGTPSSNISMIITPKADFNLGVILTASGFNVRGSKDTYIIIEEIEPYVLETPLVLDKMIGLNQTWQNMTASRVSGTTYTNTTGKPIMVVAYSMGEASGASGLWLYVNDTIINSGYTNSGAYEQLNVVGIIPNNSSYKVTIQAGTLTSCWELR